MSSKKDLEQQVMHATREQGVSSVLFRNMVGRKLGLSSSESECMSFLALRGQVAPTEIAGHIGLTTGSVTTLLDRLEKAHYIVRSPNPRDRRGVLVTVHAHYMETVRPLVGNLQHEQATLIARYSTEELAVIADFLTCFTNNVNASTDAIQKELN